MARKLKWQCGLDVYTMEHAHMMLDAVGDMPEIIEIGTPLILCEGLRAIREVRERCPNQEILVDSKIIDATTYISEPMYKAGADIITVDGGAHDYVISEAIRMAHELGKSSEVDLMNVKDLETRAQQILDMNVDIIGFHAPSQALRPNEIHHHDIRRVMSVVPSEKLCIAHSVTEETLPVFLEYKPAITVVQLPIMFSIFSGEDPAETKEKALRINEVFNKYNAML